MTYNYLCIALLFGVRPTNNSGNEDAEQTLDENTRRRFLTGSAGAVGGLALGGVFTSPVLAHDDEEDDEDEDEGDAAGDEPADAPPEAPVEDEFEDDVDILNYARLLEFLEASFYEEGLDNLSEDELLEAEPVADLGDPITDSLYDDLHTIKGHEKNHAETLGAVITSLGGEPIDEPEVDFGDAVEDPATFIATGAVLEDTGVGAYAGAAPYIENVGVVVGALSIHSVEARHASFLRELDGDVGFPSAYDQPLSRSTVVDLAGDFLVGDMDDMMSD